MQTECVPKNNVYKTVFVTHKSTLLKSVWNSKSNTLKLWKAGSSSCTLLFEFHLPFKALGPIPSIETTYEDRTVPQNTAEKVDGFYSEAIVFKYKQMYFHKIPPRLKAIIIFFLQEQR